MATKCVDLAPYFVLTRQGSYRVIATVRIKDWKEELTSPPQRFDIIDGAKLWSQTFGLPAAGGMTNRTPEVRKYTLEEANYLRSELRMYVQVSDESEMHIFKVRAVGPMVSFGTAGGATGPSQPAARVVSEQRPHLQLLDYQSRRRHHAPGKLRLSRYPAAITDRRHRRHHRSRRRAPGETRGYADGETAQRSASSRFRACSRPREALSAIWKGPPGREAVIETARKIDDAGESGFEIFKAGAGAVRASILPST